MSFFNTILSDVKSNRGNVKGIVILLLYRIAHRYTNIPVFIKPLFIPYLIFYKIVSEFILGTEISRHCIIGPGARIYHGYGLVIHRDTRIGARVTLRHGVTLGEKTSGGKAPTVGDDVDVGVNAVILGAIHIGDGAVIGAGSIVTKDIPPYAVAAGNPARILHISTPLDVAD